MRRRVLQRWRPWPDARYEAAVINTHRGAVVRDARTGRLIGSTYRTWSEAMVRAESLSRLAKEEAEETAAAAARFGGRIAAPHVAPPGATFARRALQLLRRLWPFARQPQPGSLAALGRSPAPGPCEHADEPPRKPSKRGRIALPQTERDRVSADAAGDALSPPQGAPGPTAAPSTAAGSASTSLPHGDDRPEPTLADLLRLAVAPADRRRGELHLRTLVSGKLRGAARLDAAANAVAALTPPGWTRSVVAEGGSWVASVAAPDGRVIEARRRSMADALKALAVELYRPRPPKAKRAASRRRPAHAEPRSASEGATWRPYPRDPDAFLAYVARVAGDPRADPAAGDAEAQRRALEAFLGEFTWVAYDLPAELRDELIRRRLLPGTYWPDPDPGGAGSPPR